MKVSLLKLRNESKDYFDAHDQVKSFFWGDFLRHYADNQIKHAVIVASPMRASNISRKSVQVQLLVTYASRVFSDFSNLDEVHSDALDVLSDFVDAINYAPRWTDFVSGATAGNAEMFTQRTGDLVAGAAMFITLTIKNTVDLCAQPLTDYDFDLSPQPLPGDCLPATIVNSDGEFSINVPSGGNYELPNTPVLVTDLVGNPLGGADLPSVTGGTIEIDIEPTPCADALFTVEYANGDPIESGTIPSGGSELIVVPNCEPCDDSTYQLTLDGEPLEGGSGSIPSGENANIPIDAFIPVCDPVTIQLRDSAANNIGSPDVYAAGTTTNKTAPDGVVTVNRDGVFFATQAVLSNGVATVNVPSDCPASLPQGGRLPFKSGQTTVYEAGDDGTTQRGQEFFTLPFTNPFGNTTRFLDTLGGTAYANGIVLDLSTTQWLTATTGTFMGYVFVGAPTNWANQVANALAATHGGFSGWSIFNDRELMSLSVDDGSVNNSLNHSGLLVPNTFMLHTGKTNTNGTAQNIQRSISGVITVASKSNNGRRIDARLFNFTISGSTVTLS